MTTEGHTDRIASDAEVQMKERCSTEFLHVKKLAPPDFITA